MSRATEVEHRRLSARIGYWAGGDRNGWYIRYRRGGAWGRNHYGTFIDCLRCWLRVQRGREPLAHLAPYGEHL